MFSKTILLTFAVGIVSISSEPIHVKLDHPSEQYQAVVDCLRKAYEAVANTLSPTGSPSMTEEQRAKFACVFFRAMAPCLMEEINTLKESNAKVPRILLLSAAYESQHIFLTRQSKMCQEIPEAAELRKILSGVLKKGEFKDIENETYDPCVKNITRSCFAEIEMSFEQQANKFNPKFDYIECYEMKFGLPTCKSCDPCNAPMLDVFIKNGDVLRGEWRFLKSSS